MNNSKNFPETVRLDLKQLSVAIGCRPVGSDANQKAEAYIAQRFAELGWEVERQGFDCLDWEDHGSSIAISGHSFPAVTNFFSPSASVMAPMIFINSFDRLEESPEFHDKIIVLHGEITQSSIMPRNFTFYNPPEHLRLNQFMENVQPRGVIAVSHLSPRPVPIIEDGDFLIPSVTVSPETGEQLLTLRDQLVSLTIEAKARPSRGANVIARLSGKNPTDKKKVILCAHMDTKYGTPGALDNAAGVAALLNLAERMVNNRLNTNLELIAFNGEDYYSVPGQMAYLNKYLHLFPNVSAAINIDGIGVRDKETTIAYFNCPEHWIDDIERMRGKKSGFIRTDPWPSSDHSIFTPYGIPALAFTSAVLYEWIDTIIHTPLDSYGEVDQMIITETGEFIAEILHYLDKTPG